MSEINYKIVTLDVETTGLPPKNANYETDFMSFPHIVTMAFKVNGEETKQFIINQEGRKIPPHATELHGITDEMAEASPFKLLDVLLLLIADAKDVDFTVGHNIYFDSSTIKANVLRMIQEGKASAGLYELIQAVLHKDRRIDTMKSTIKFCALPGSKWPKLTELYFKLFGEQFDAHNSKNDVDATYRSFVELVKLGVITLIKKA